MTQIPAQPNICSHMTTAVRKKTLYSKMDPCGQWNKTLHYFCLTNIVNKIRKTKGNADVKMIFAGFSTVLVGHTLQQSNVVSFQHDPPWET